MKGPPVAVCVALLCLPGFARSAANGDARIVLHAVPHAPSNTCSTPVDAGLDCDSVRPTTSVAASADVEVYVYIQNFDAVAAAQMAFDWDPSWIFLYWAGGCQSNEVLGQTAPTSSGDSYIAAFDAVTSGEMMPLGRLRFSSSGNGGTALTVVETWAPGGTAILDDQAGLAAIPVERRGRVDVGGPGFNSCGGDSKSKAFF